MAKFSKLYTHSSFEHPSQGTFRVISIGVTLSLLHAIGVFISVYFLFTRLIEPDKTEKPFHHACTSAILCPFYRIVQGLGAISVQLSGSILGLVINLTLLRGVFYSVTWALLLWLLSYIFAICGCLGLFGVIIAVLIQRDNEEGDVATGTYFICLLPLFLGSIYVICWILVFKLWRNMKLKDRQFFVCID